MNDRLTGPGPVPDPHGPDHQGCSTCDPLRRRLPAGGTPRLSTVRVRARGEDFRVVQLQGQLFVCTRQNGSCCCGWEEKGRSIWLKDLNDPALVPRVFEYVEAMLDAGTVLPVPDGLLDHVYERYLAPPEDTWLRLGEDQSDEGDGLDRLDPVCLMEVDPATARHTLEYAGRTIVFCAPSCKKLFLVAPSAYLVF